MACKIASVDPGTRMYLLGVSTQRAGDWDNRVQRNMTHVLTHGGHLQESGDWDQQANWTKCGIPLWVMDDKYGQAVCDVKGQEPVEKGQAKLAQAPAAKRKSTSQEIAPEKKKSAASPQAAKAVIDGYSDGSNEEEEDEEAEEEKGPSSATKPKKAAERLQTEEVPGTIRAPFKQPARQSAPREQPAKPAPNGKTSLAKSLNAKLATAPKKK